MKIGFSHTQGKQMENLIVTREREKVFTAFSQLFLNFPSQIAVWVWFFSFFHRKLSITFFLWWFFFSIVHHFLTNFPQLFTTASLEITLTIHVPSHFVVSAADWSAHWIMWNENKTLSQNSSTKCSPFRTAIWFTRLRNNAALYFAFQLNVN